MTGLIFWDVDTQYDFMHADGKLYVPDAESIIPNLARLTEHAHANGIRIVASADDHVPQHREISDTPDFEHTFPPHCLRGTAGQRKIPETAGFNPLVVEPTRMDPRGLSKQVRAHEGDLLLHKHWFDVFTNPNTETVVEAIDPTEIVLYGVALDVCNRYAVEGLLRRRPHTRLHLVTDATKPIDAAAGAALLADWRNRGVAMITTDEAVQIRAAASPASQA